MKKVEFLRIAVSYLRRHLKAFVLFGLFTSIFAFVFFLYSLPVEATAYADLMCICVWLLFSIFDFWRYYKKHQLLSELLSRVTLSIEGMPPPGDLIEQDYQRLIEAVHTDKMLIASSFDNAKSDMVDYYTLWAHQIKTPIAAIRLLLQSGESGRNDELAMELFKIEQYADMVLQYLRLDSDSTDFIIKRHDLDGIVRQAVRKYAKMFIRKKIKLDYQPLNYKVLTDEKWLAFAIEQVLSNALKYTDEGGISIYMEGGALVVEDTGIGIQAEDLPRVFEKGFTGYNGRIDRKSTGIGLYLCKRALAKLSHTISIESEVGRGTKVKIGLSSIDMAVE